MVRAGEQRRRSLRGAGLRHDLGRRGSLGHRLARGPLVRDLVEAVAQPLREPAGVGEDDRRAVRLDEVGDPLLDVRPDRRLLPSALGRVGGGGAAQLTQVLDRYDHGEVELLARGRLDDLDPALRREETRNLVHRPHRRRQPDPAGRSRQQLVEPLQRHREMGAALGPGHGVHLVEDHRLDTRQRIPGGGGEHQEQRLGRGDQDVRRPGGQRPALGGRGVARADADPDVGLRQPEAHGLLPDTGQRAAEIALHVHGERFERRHVQDPAACLRVRGRRRGREPVEGGQEGCQRLAGSGRRHDQDVRAFPDGPPGSLLRGGGRAERPREPASGRGGEEVERSPGHVPHRAPGH